VKRMPSAARRSMLGVTSGVLPPKQPGASQFMSSAVIRRMFGRFGDRARPKAGLDRVAPRAQPVIRKNWRREHDRAFIIVPFQIAARHAGLPLRTAAIRIPVRYSPRNPACSGSLAVRDGNKGDGRTDGMEQHLTAQRVETSFRIQSDMISSAAGDKVSSIFAYSAGDPVVAVWNRWFRPGSSLMVH